MAIETLEKFNKIGEALTYLTTQEARQAAKVDLSKKDLGNKKKLQEIRKLDNVKNLAQEMGLVQDQE